MLEFVSVLQHTPLDHRSLNAFLGKEINSVSRDATGILSDQNQTLRNCAARRKFLFIRLEDVSSDALDIAEIVIILNLGGRRSAVGLGDMEHVQSGRRLLHVSRLRVYSISTRHIAHLHEDFHHLVHGLDTGKRFQLSLNTLSLVGREGFLQ
ncbi:hypothetical protein BMS3Bbin04_01917 [bacterium BMS3Bbin04]|nr:hypothetical protein BMS3Bbin04_01917 [bacterium BMS3Bbin04]